MCKKSKNSTRRVKQPNVEDLLQLFSPEINYVPLLTTFPTYYSLDKKTILARHLYFLGQNLLA